MRELVLLRALLLARPELQKGPSLHRQKRERYDLGGREERPERHVDRGRAAEIHMVHGSDHAADGVKEDIQVDDTGRRFRGYDSQEYENVGHHDGREQLQEILDPKVHHPEAPEIGDGEIGPGVGEQTDGIEQRNRKSAVKEEMGEIGVVFGLQLLAEPAEQNHAPDDQSEDQQPLPEAAEVEILPALRAYDRTCAALNHSLVTRGLAGEAAHDHYEQSAQESKGEKPLAARFGTRDHRRKKDPRGQ